MIDLIKQARALYERKRIINRDVIRKEIALSWARSSMLNIDPTIQMDIIGIGIDKIKLTQNEKLTFGYIDKILILNNELELNSIYIKDKVENLAYLNYSESKIGTNAFSLALNYNKEFYVSHYEHYNENFFGELTFALPMYIDEQYFILGFELSMSFDEFKVKREKIMQFSEVLIQKLKNSTLIQKSVKSNDLDIEDKVVLNKNLKKEARIFLQDKNIRVKTIAEVEKQEIVKVLKLTEYNISLSAKLLGIGRSTLYRKIDKYNIKID